MPPLVTKKLKKNCFWEHVCKRAMIITSCLFLVGLCIATANYQLYVPIFQYGLANRFRLLASAMILAKKTERNLVVDWRRSNGCNVLLSDIVGDVAKFERDNQFTLITEQTEDDMNKILLAPAPKPLANVTFNTAMFNETVAIVNLGGIYANGALLDLLSAPDFPLVILKANGMIISHTTPCASYYNAKKSIYTSLMGNLNADISAQLGQFDNFFNSATPIVGVHFRSFDARYDWAVVPPQKNLLNSSGTVTDGGGEGDKAQTWEDVR